MPGLPGEPGVEGIGIPGPKVYFNLCFKFVCFSDACICLYVQGAYSAFDHFMSVSG